MGLFASTAPWYARYRPQYPTELIARLAAAAGLRPSSRVLDLGSGPGHVAVPLATQVAEVVAVDPEADMLARIDAPNVRPVLGRAEDVDASWGRFDLVTAGRSFHWFDQPLVFERLPLVSDQLALLGDSILLSEPQSIALDVAAELLEEERHWREAPRARYAEVLAASPYSDVETIEVEAERTWTVDSLIGLVYSTSFASPARLGDRCAEFERRLRETLPEGKFRERVTVAAVLGRRHE